MIRAVEDVEEAEFHEAQGSLVPARVEPDEPGISREFERADRSAGRRVRCPTLFLWAAHDDMEYLYGDPLAIWGAWADDVRGQRIDSGHHMAEDAPEELSAVLRSFLAEG